MLRPEQLLLSDLLARRVRDAEGLDLGAGVLGWMHPPVHRLLGWASRPSALAQRRCIWRLDQLEGLGDGEVFVQGAPAETDAATLERLPTLLGAVLYGAGGVPLGRLVDAAFDSRSGAIRHYLVARSDPRLPGSSRWRLTPERLLDQRSGEVFSALGGLEDLPLAQASLRETLRRRSRRWREQLGEETSRWREQWQHTSGRLEERLEGWLEEPPWQEPPPRRSSSEAEIWPEPSWPPHDAEPEANSAAAAGRRPLSRRRPGAAADDGGFDAAMGPAQAWGAPDEQLDPDERADAEQRLDGDDWGEAAWPDPSPRRSGASSGREIAPRRPEPPSAPPGGSGPGDDDPWV
ncbi:MAG: RNA methyltransferase [Cyanobium sp.]